MTRDEMRERHGTPAEFEVAVWAAWAQLFCTTDEAENAITAYRIRWGEAQ